MISGRHVSIDGTQIQANASIQSFERRAESESNPPPQDSPPKKDDTPENDRPGDPPSLTLVATKPHASKANSSAAFKDPQPQGAWRARGERFSNETHVSRTDADARLYKKGGAGARLSYLVHDVIDTKSRVILARRASVATGTAERAVGLDLLDEHEERRGRMGLNQTVEILSADGGYGTGEFVADVIDRGILPHVPLQAHDEPEEIPSWQRPTYSLERYRQRREALRQALARNQVRLAQKKHGYIISRKLRIRSEHIFAEAKNEHGLGRARYRGLERMDRQSLLIATVQNLKRLAETLRRQANAASADFGYLGYLLHVLRAVFAPTEYWTRIRDLRRLRLRIERHIRPSLINRSQKLNFSTAF
jgi:hypothetical protein